MAHDRACGSLASLLRDDPPAPARSAPEEVHGPRKQKIAKVYDVETGTLRALGSGGGHAHLAAEIAILGSRLTVCIASIVYELVRTPQLLRCRALRTADGIPAAETIRSMRENSIIVTVAERRRSTPTLAFVEQH